MPHSSLSERLIGQLLELDDEALPDRILETVVSRMVDTLGTALCAAALGEGIAATQAFTGHAGDGGASFWATGGLSGRPADVVLANGALCHAMDFDDTHTGSVVHPSGLVLPTAIALGEATGASGRATLAAAAIGYEAAIRLGLGAPGVFQPRGFQGSALLGPFAAALVAGRLLNAPEGVLVNAWGLAGSMASGINEFHTDGSQAKQFHLGWAAHSGIIALALASAGATGPATVLEGSNGVFSVFGGTRIDEEAMFREIGDRFHLEEIAPKPYPACHCIHAVIDAWRHVAKELQLQPGADQVERITCLVPEWYVNIVLEPRSHRQNPPTSYAARFSLPYCLGRAVLDGDLDVRSFSTSPQPHPALRRVIGIIDYEVRDFPEFPEYFPGGVRVQLRNGSIHEHVVRHNRGSDLAPLSREVEASKLEEAGLLFGSSTFAANLLTAIHELPGAADLSQLTAALAGFVSPHFERSSA